MSEHETPPSAPAEPAAALSEDRFKNYQQEISRKLENQNAQMQQLIASLTKPAPSLEASKKVSVFEDENAYAQRISEETERRIEAKLEARNAQQAKYSQVINQIVSDYPEANDTSSPLYLRSQEIYSSLSSEEKSSPLAMKMAVTGAASEMGIKPKSKRSAPTNDDNFSMSGGSSNSSSSRSKPRDGDIDAATLEFARMLGRPVDSPEYLKKLKETSKNAAWKRKS